MSNEKQETISAIVVDMWEKEQRTYKEGVR